ncbi:MAG: FHA domain-containing protein [Lachnospiraceae bacterium]|nr:FHA domain-containing protein [Lachnospiraceae bacterium]
MAKFKLASDKNLTKFVKKYLGKVPVNERELQLFETNIIPGFFRPQLQGKHKIEYIAPASKSLEQYMKKDMTVHKLYNILAQVVEITKRVEMNGFYLSNLVLDERLVYVREVTGELIFLYEPVESRENSANVFAFLADLVIGIKSEAQDVQRECDKLNAFFSRPGNYRMNDIENFIMSNYPQIYQRITRVESEYSGKSGFIASSQLSFEEHYANHNAAPVNTYQQYVTNDDSEGGTTLLMEEDEGGTTLLSYDDEDEGGTTLLTQYQPVAKLYRRRSMQEYEIHGYEFKVGKNTMADCCITDNKAISRTHATILQRGMEYVIRDENSTNRTYLNERMLEPGREELLQSGDVIRLADEEFNFYVE